MPVAPDGTPLPYPGDTTGFPPTIQVGGEPAASETGSDPLSLLREGIGLVHQALAADGLSEDEKLLLEKLTTLGQQVFAGRQKNADKMLGMGAGLRQALGG